MNTIRAFHLLFALLLAMPAVAAERILELSIDEATAVQVHNLVGAARIVPGDGPLLIRATVTAERQDLADGVSLRQTERRDGIRVVVDYPDSVTRVRYDGEEFRRFDAVIDHAGRRIRVNDSKGDLIRVDLEIFVPADRVLALHQGVGGVVAERVHADLELVSRFGAVRVADGAGRLAVTTGSGRVGVTGFRGDVTTTSGSGSAGLENVLGRVHAKTGSGVVSLRGIDGDVIAETGSGGVQVNDIIGTLNARTGSGSVRVEGLEAGPELKISTGSGSVAVAGDLGSVEELVVRTGSGGVTIESSTSLSLSLHLSTGSGNIRVDVPMLSDVDSGRRSFRAVVGAGAGTARVATGSGSIRITAP
jgi:hypothetical protein